LLQGQPPSKKLGNDGIPVCIPPTPLNEIDLTVKFWEKNNLETAGLTGNFQV
jgi:hypothetical protein